MILWACGFCYVVWAPGVASTATSKLCIRSFRLHKVNILAYHKHLASVANMLHLDSLAGLGYSACTKGGTIVGCMWDVVNEGGAYAQVNDVNAFR